MSWGVFEECSCSTLGQQNTVAEMMTVNKPGCDFQKCFLATNDLRKIKYIPLFNFKIGMSMVLIRSQCLFKNTAKKRLNIAWHIVRVQKNEMIMIRKNKEEETLMTINVCPILFNCSISPILWDSLQESRGFDTCFLSTLLSLGPAPPFSSPHTLYFSQWISIFLNTPASFSF